MNSEYGHGMGSEQDHRTTGRWSREEHEKFIQGKFTLNLYISLSL